MNILVAGLGKLGLPLAVFLKSKGHRVYGYDIDGNRIVNLSTGTYDAWEPGCDKVTVSLLRLTSDLANAVIHTEMAFICAQTPIKPDGTMDTSFVIAAAKDIARRLDESVPYTIVMASTVMPGTCEDIQEDLPENARILSMPVWIAMGTVLKDLGNPPVLVVGCDCREMLEATGITGPEWTPLGFCEHQGDVESLFDTSQRIRTNTRTAEFIKLAHNAWCCIKMSWLGDIGDHAEDLGIDVGALSAFMAHGGERPGAFWKYGPPFGGPCFPRDLRFWLQSFGDVIGGGADRINENRLAKIAGDLMPYNNICIVGEGYKKGVPVDEAAVSKTLELILTTAHKQRTVTYWPEGRETAQVFIRMHDDDTTAFPLPQDGRPIINTWRA